MKVEMKMQIQGSRNGVRWPVAGSVVDLPNNEAADLCVSGLASPVVDRPKPEGAVAAGVETRDGAEAAKPRRAARTPKAKA